jgi:membrane protease YdiL (CAAX protease family)
MSEPLPCLEETKKGWPDKIQALLEVLLLSGLLSSLIAAAPFSFPAHKSTFIMNDARLVSGFLLLEASITLVFLIVIMRIHGETFSLFGLHRQNWSRYTLIGIGIVPALFLVNILVAVLFKLLFPSYYLDRNPLIEMVKTPRDLALFLICGIYAGGVKEELQRAFILMRFRNHLGGSTLGLLLWSAAFAAGHYLQGPQGMVVAGIFGLIFGLVYLASRNLVAPIVAHGLYDTVAILGFWIFSDSGRHM